MLFALRMSSSARFLWLSALTASLGVSVEAATLACYQPERHTLAFIECFSSGEGGTECDGHRFDLVDGGVSKAPWPTETKDGGEMAPFWSSAVLRQLQDSLDEGRGLSADGPGCLPVRRVDLSRAMTVRVIPHVLTPTDSEVQEAQGGLGSFSGHWPDREVALSLAGKRVAQLELKDLKVDGVKVIGFDVGDHQHLLLLVSWGGFGFEGSVAYVARQVLVNVDASTLKTATDGAFRASAGLDVQAEEAAFAKLMAATLAKTNAPGADEWARYATESDFLLRLRAAPTFRAAKAALDLVPDEAPDDDPGVLRAVFAVRQWLLPLSKDQRRLGAEPIMRSSSERQTRLLIAVSQGFEQPTWTVRVVRDGGVEEETLTFTPTGFRRRDGTTVKLPEPGHRARSR